MEGLFDSMPFALFTAPHGQHEFAQLGRGSFGSVLGGELFGTAVALKEVRPTSEYDVDKYFERELEMLRHLRHPNIVQYMGLARSPPPASHIYIVTERITGGTLADRVANRSQPFPWHLRLSLVTDVARALCYIHTRRCLHRDVKGDNVLITTNDRAKLCDFGFARMAASNASEMARISFLGTSAYMAPELLLGEDYGHPADTFSFGVILCEVVCRTMATEFPRAGRYKGIDPQQVRALASPDCPPDLLHLALACIRVRPQDRPDMHRVVTQLAQLEFHVTQQQVATATLTTNKEHQLFSVGSLSPTTLRAAMEHRQNRHHKHRAMPAVDPPPVTSHLAEHDGDETDIGVARETRLSGTRSSAKPTHPELGEGVGGNKHASNRAQVITSYSHADLPSNMLDQVSLAEPVREPAPAPVEGRMLLPELAGRGKTNKSSGTGDSLDATDGWLPTEHPTHIPSVLDNVLEHVSHAHPSQLPTNNMAFIDQPSSGDIGTGRIYSIAAIIRSGTGHHPIVPHHSLARFSAPLSRPDPQADPPPPKPTCNREEEVLPTPMKVSLLESSPAPTQPLPSPEEGKEVAEHCHGTPTAPNIEAPCPDANLRPHSFTLANNGACKRWAAQEEAADLEIVAQAEATGGNAGPRVFGTMIPPALLLANSLSHCSACGHMIGWRRPFLDCDNCPYRTHGGCGHLASHNCQFIPDPTMSYTSAEAKTQHKPTNLHSTPPDKLKERPVPIPPPAAKIGGQDASTPRPRPTGLAPSIVAAARPVPALDNVAAPNPSAARAR